MDSQRLAWAALSLVTLILSVAIHEFAHAFAAHKLGDDLPESEGRLTLNPLVHMDPIGTLLVPAIAAISGFGAFGWGRPVQTLPTRYTRKMTMRGGEALVAFAGPASNLLMALACSIGFGFIQYEIAEWAPTARQFLGRMAILNFSLFILNLIPVPPLDGSKIVAWMFGQKADGPLDTLSSLGPMVPMLVILGAGLGIGFASESAFFTITALLSG
jgi:Zn-dependent protease